MVLVHLQPVVIVIVCHAIATDGGVGGVLDHGLCLAWTYVSVSVLLSWWSGSHCVGSIRWCVWSVRPSGPLRLPHLKCLLLLFVVISGRTTAATHWLMSTGFYCGVLPKSDALSQIESLDGLTFQARSDFLAQLSPFRGKRMLLVRGAKLNIKAPCMWWLVRPRESSSS